MSSKRHSLKWIVLSFLILSVGALINASLLRTQILNYGQFLGFFDPIGQTTTSTTFEELKTCNESMQDFNVYIGEMEELILDAGYTYELTSLTPVCGTLLTVSSEVEGETLSIWLRNYDFKERYEFFYYNENVGEKTNYENIPTELFFALLAIFSNQVILSSDFDNLLIERAGEYDAYIPVSTDPLRFYESRGITFSDVESMEYRWHEEHFTSQTRLYETIHIDGIVKPR